MKRAPKTSNCSKGDGDAHMQTMTATKKSTRPRLNAQQFLSDTAKFQAKKPSHQFVRSPCHPPLLPIIPLSCNSLNFCVPGHPVQWRALAEHVHFNEDKVGVQRHMRKVTRLPWCAAADAAAFICNALADATSSQQIAEDTASAFALAVASASVECELQGDAYVQVDASSSAVAAAEVWVGLYANAVAEAGACEKCDAYASSFVIIEQGIFLEAVAQADVHVRCFVHPPLSAGLITPGLTQF